MSLLLLYRPKAGINIKLLVQINNNIINIVLYCYYQNHNLSKNKYFSLIFICKKEESIRKGILESLEQNIRLG